MKSIAVLLTVHNRREKTLACLERVYSQQNIADISLDVFLTNDGCTDGTKEAVQELFPQVHIVDGDGTLFWNRGMYKAWQAASQHKNYDFYLWLNDDTNLNDTALKTLLMTSSKLNDEAVIIGTTTSAKDTETLTYGGTGYNDLIVVPDKEQPIQCKTFNGNIVLIPSSIYEKIGKNDPIFRHAVGDTDYGLRVTATGLKNYVAPGILGTCEQHDKLPTWRNPDKTFSERWKSFRTPLGLNPEEFFVFERRHYGLFKALYHYCTNHLRVVAPNLWGKK